MCIRCQRHLPGALQHLAQRGVPAQVVAQHHDVDEEPDELVQVGLAATGHRGADGDVYPAAGLV